MEDSSRSEFDVQTFDNFLKVHRYQLETSGVPQHMWVRLFQKLQNGVFDAGNYFTIMKKEYESEDSSDNETEDNKSCDYEWCVMAKTDVDVNSDNCIFLIDHLWTFKVNEAKSNLLSTPNLIQNMARVMDVTDQVSAAETNSDAAEIILKHMWKFVLPYSMKLTDNIKDSLPIWYVMDDLGCRVQHSDEPNVRIVPFYYASDCITYSLMFPIKTIESEEEITRDYVEGITDENVRSALLQAWKDDDLLDDVDMNPPEVSEDYFTGGRVMETIPVENQQDPTIPSDRPLRVYSDYSFVNEYLKHSRFEIIKDEKEADILWLTNHFKNFYQLSTLCPNMFINQFPGENVVVVKDLMSIVARRENDRPMIISETLEGCPTWLPVTYNLKTELPNFLSYFKRRQQMGLDNHWICKPWNLGRSLDISVTDNLTRILRLPSTGPKIACKYLNDPVLFQHGNIGLVKFDIRYIVLLKSVDPLIIYFYDRFWLRFANKPFSLDDLDEYEKHFTVMNYSEVSDFKQMYCHNFIKQLIDQNPQLNWEKIESHIKSCVKSLFAASASNSATIGIIPDKQSRAVYGIDVMLEWNDKKDDVQPKLLEVNFMPDCQRACEYYSDFYDDIFSVLFLDECKDRHVSKI